MVSYLILINSKSSKIAKIRYHETAYILPKVSRKPTYTKCLVGVGSVRFALSLAYLLRPGLWPLRAHIYIYINSYIFFVYEKPI